MWQFQVPRIAPQWTPEQAAQEWEIVTVLPAPGTHTAVGHWVYLRQLAADGAQTLQRALKIVVGNGTAAELSGAAER